MLPLEMKLVILVSLLKIFREVQSSGDATKYVNPRISDTKDVIEGANSSIYIYIVEATDREGDALTYSIHSQTPSRPSFIFDPGSRKLFPPVTLDAEKTISFAIEFSVTDGTSTVISPVLTINIQDVNEHSPEFNQTLYTASIYDTASNGVVVLTVVAIDLDVTATLAFSITAGDSSTFSINATSGEISVARAGKLNAASTPSYTLTVQVSDTSTTASVSVSITVLDDPCLPNPCKNSGNCLVSGTTYQCECTSGYSGENCSNVKGIFIMFPTLIGIGVTMVCLILVITCAIYSFRKFIKSPNSVSTTNKEIYTIT